MKRRSQPKVKKVGSYSRKRKSPNSMMYGPRSHGKWDGRILSKAGNGRLRLCDFPASFQHPPTRQIPPALRKYQ